MAIVIDDLLVGVGAYLTYEGVLWGIEQFRRWRLGRKTKDIRVHLEPTAEDRQLIDKCREIMKRNFPEGIEVRMKGMSSSERMELFRGLVEELNGVYGVEMSDIQFLSNYEIGAGVLGYYNKEDNSICFNVDLLNMDDADVLQEMVGTIFHEMRHAQQFRAVTDSSFNYGSEEQLKLWALNFVKYIPAHVDFAYYQEQAVEDDARQIASEIIKEY